MESEFENEALMEQLEQEYADAVEAAEFLFTMDNER